MVLRTLLLIVILLHTGILSACDPNSQPEEIFTSFHTPSVSPGIVAFAANMALIQGLSLPATWESVDTNDSQGRPGELDTQLFLALLPVFGSLADKLQEDLAGRVILKASPVLVRAFRDALQSGSWQTLVVQVTVPVSGKVVIYRKNGKIEFIDEIDSTLNFSLTSAWPPVLFKHIRVWDRHGMIFAWPEEDTVLPEGVASAQ
jgi:hypothetical protein